MYAWLWHFAEKIRKFFFCRFFHRKGLCHPEVWGRGLAGSWHCGICHPCNEVWDYIEGKPIKGTIGYLKYPYNCRDKMTPEQTEVLMAQARGVAQCGAHVWMHKQWGPQIGPFAYMGCTECATKVTEFFVEFFEKQATKS